MAGTAPDWGPTVIQHAAAAGNGFGMVNRRHFRRSYTDDCRSC
jgi:hypothetical protein